MSQYRKTIYYNTTIVNRVSSNQREEERPWNMINGKRWREIDKIEPLSLRLFNDVTPFSKFLSGRIKVINCYSII